MKSRYAWMLGAAALAAACGMARALEEGAPAAKAEPRKPDPAVTEWVASIAPRITDGNEVVRRSAVHAMIAVGPDALPALGKLAASDDPKVAGIAMDLIVAIKSGGPGGHRGPGGPEGMRHGPGGPGGPDGMHGGPRGPGGPDGMRGGPGGPGGPDGMHGGPRGPGGPGGPDGMHGGPGGPGGPDGMRGGPRGPGGPERMFEALGLSDEQKAKMQEALKATHERVRKETEAEIQKILTPEQWQKFQEHHQPRGPQEPQGAPGR